MTPQLFTCNRHHPKLRTTAEGCGKLFRKVMALHKQSEKLKKKKNKDGSEKKLPWPDLSFLDLNKACINCKTGEQNMQEIKSDTKTCPCGKKFSRKPNSSWAIWQRTKYCPEHSAMDPYQRKKELEKLGIEIPKRKVRDLEAEQQVKTQKLEVSNHVEKQETSVEKRECSVCGGEFELTLENFHKKGDGLSYRCKTCRNKAKRDRRAGKVLIDLKAPPNGIIVLDLRKETSLLKKIKKWAAAERREIAPQILWNIEKETLPYV